MPNSLVAWCLALLVLAIGAPLSAEVDVDELPDLTGGLIALLYAEQTFGGSGQLYSGGRITSRGEARYEVRVKNQSGDPVDADSLVVVVQKIQDARLHDLTKELEFRGADGYTQNGQPYFRVPTGGEPELAPYAESEAFTLEIGNPNLARLYPPVLRVRGIRRTASDKVQKTLQTLVKKGVLSEEQAEEVLTSGPDASLQ